MQNISARDAKARFGQLLELAQLEPVIIEKHGREVAVVISREEFESIKAMKLDHLRSEIQKGLDDLSDGKSISLANDKLPEFAESIKSRGRQLKS